MDFCTKICVITRFVSHYEKIKYIFCQICNFPCFLLFSVHYYMPCPAARSVTVGLMTISLAICLTSARPVVFFNVLR